MIFCNKHLTMLILLTCELTHNVVTSHSIIIFYIEREFSIVRVQPPRRLAGPFRPELATWMARRASHCAATFGPRTLSSRRQPTRRDIVCLWGFNIILLTWSLLSIVSVCKILLYCFHIWNFNGHCMFLTIIILYVYKVNKLKFFNLYYFNFFEA